MNENKKTELKKEELKNKFYRLFLSYKPVTEKEIFNTNIEFFTEVINTFESWSKFEKETGFLQRHLREREKFLLYMTMKTRAKDEERFGPDCAVEALRHKNIDETLKEKIAENFGTVRNLTNFINKNWNEDRVIFEAHSLFITGAEPHELAEKDPIMYDYLIEIFKGKDGDPAKAVENFYNEYVKRFMINPLEIAKASAKANNEANTGVEQRIQEIEEKEMLPTGRAGIDISTLEAIGYISSENANVVKESARMPREQILDYVSKLDSSMKDSELAKKDMTMWLAVKNVLGGLTNARKELSKTKELQKQA
ncbi:hypothetical protein [Priestia megaterium]|uniref:Uncharacterized protein n=1 Tax=Priestia megaterium TaxID=1404 RepID=A0A6M6E166_PRIMG|nr:hypothetical protein [Priestia megaterium]QJX80560.1 hypothetical protein FDZ14_31210 [Priestia megaterium]